MNENEKKCLTATENAHYVIFEYVKNSMAVAMLKLNSNPHMGAQVSWCVKSVEKLPKGTLIIN